jgi:hypothetical protein
VERIECLERKEPLSKEPEVEAVQSLNMVETQPTSAAQPSTADNAPAISTLQANKSGVYGYEIRMSCVAREDMTEPGLLSLLRDEKTTFKISLSMAWTFGSAHASYMRFRRVAILALLSHSK